MTGPPWLPASLAAVMILIAAYCASRLIAHRLLAKRTDVDADGLHVLMGVAMAGMFEPALSLLPGTMWRFVFLAAATWFGCQVLIARRLLPSRLRSSHPVPHAVESAAMTYMLWPTAAPRAGPGAAMPMHGMDGTSGNLALTIVLAVFMLGYTLWTTDRLADPPRPAPASPARRDRHDLPDPWPAADPGARASAARMTARRTAGRPALAPRLAAGYKITMSVTMSYMLISML